MAEKKDNSHENGCRTHLPVPMFSRAEFSVWSVLKQCIGRELSKITMPVIFNEPLSLLQRVTEYLEYGNLLRTAAQTDDPLLRMQYVAAFVVSSISSNWERVCKPFNPLLGETFEFEREDMGFRMVSEQVSHHPPVSAFHVDGNGYIISGSIQPKLRFLGKSVEITPKGMITLYLRKYDDVYTWQNVNCCIHNVIFGKLWVEHCGTMEIRSSRSTMRTVLNFQQCGWFSKDLHRVDGMIFGSNKKKLKALAGNWILGLFAVDVDENESMILDSSRVYSMNSSMDVVKNNEGSSVDIVDHVKTSSSLSGLKLPSERCLWRASSRPLHSDNYFCFTAFSMALNQLTDVQKLSIAPTDSRLRPDIRSLEEGDIEEAASQKDRLEEKQRIVWKERKKMRQDWVPLWFKQGINPFTGTQDWVYTGKYFSRDWTSCPDIF